MAGKWNNFVTIPLLHFSFSVVLSFICTFILEISCIGIFIKKKKQLEGFNNFCFFCKIVDNVSSICRFVLCFYDRHVVCTFYLISMNKKKKYDANTCWKIKYVIRMLYLTIILWLNVIKKKLSCGTDILKAA